MQGITASYSVSTELPSCHWLTLRIAHTSAIDVEMITIDDVLKERDFPDLLSIDIESMDYEVLASINYKNSSPKVICAECPIGTDDAAKIRKLLIDNGYFFYVRTGGNAIFLRDEFKEVMSC